MIARHRIVVQMPSQQLLHPCSGLRDGVVHTLAQLHLDRLEPGSQALLDRLAPDDKRVPLARSRAEVREAEEVEGFGLPLSKLLPLFGRRRPKTCTTADVASTGYLAASRD